MERKELLAKNVEIISAHAAALNELAARDVKIVVVANPANTLALVAKKAAPSLPAEAFSCLTRLDHDRLRGAVAKKLTAGRPAGAEVTAIQVGWGLRVGWVGCARGGMPACSSVLHPPHHKHKQTNQPNHLPNKVRNAVIWGNHSSTQVPSAAQAEVNFSGSVR